MSTQAKPVPISTTTIVVIDKATTGGRRAEALPACGGLAVRICEDDNAALPIVAATKEEPIAAIVVELGAPGLNAITVVNRPHGDGPPMPVRVRTAKGGGIDAALKTMGSDVVAAPASGPHPQAPDDQSVRLLDACGHARSLNDIEADAIAHALARHRWQMSEVARRLGIGRSTLYRKVREHSLSRAASSM